MTAIHVPYTKLSYQKYSHKHIHLHYTLQLVLVFSRSTILSVELSSEQIRTVSNIPYTLSYCMLKKNKSVRTAIRLALRSSELNQTYHIVSCLGVIIHFFWFCLFGKIQSYCNKYVYMSSGTQINYLHQNILLLVERCHIYGKHQQKNYKIVFSQTCQNGANIPPKYFRE